MISVGRVRGLFDPMMEALPTLGTLAVLLVGTVRLESGATTRRASWSGWRTCSPCWRCRSGRSAGCSPTCPAWWSAGTGCRACSPPAAARPTAPRRLDGAGRPAGLAVRGVSFGYGEPAGSGGCRAGRSRAGRRPAGRAGPAAGAARPRLRRRARPHRRAGRPHRERQVHAGHAAGPAGRPGHRRGAGGRRRPARAAARRGLRHAALVSQSTFLFDDTVRGNVTLGAEIDGRRGVGGAAAGPGRPVRRRAARRARHPGRRARHDAVRRPAAAARAGPGAGPPAAAARPRRRHQQRRPDGRGGRSCAGCARPTSAPTVVVVAYRRATIALADEVVYVEHGRVVARGTHAELVASTPGYALLVNAYDDEAARRRALARGRRSARRRRRRPGGSRVTGNRPAARPTPPAERLRRPAESVAGEPAGADTDPPTGVGADGHPTARLRSPTRWRCASAPGRTARCGRCGAACGWSRSSAAGCR